MTTVYSLLAQVTLLQVSIYFCISFIIWYLAFALEMFLNGGNVGRGRWWVFKCFWEELLWFIPGGLKRRADYIRDIVSHGDGLVGGYWYEDIKKRNLYEQVAQKALGNGFYFWGVNVALFFFLWPVMLAFVVLCMAVSAVIGCFDDMIVGVSELSRRLKAR